MYISASLAMKSLKDNTIRLYSNTPTDIDPQDYNPVKLPSNIRKFLTLPMKPQKL